MHCLIKWSHAHCRINVILKIQSTLVISKSKGPKKQFEISVLRHIRFVVLRKKQFEQPNFTNDYVN